MYVTDHTTGDEVYAALGNGQQTYEGDRYAKRGSGDEYYALDSRGETFYRRDADGREVYATESKGDQFYRLNTINDQVYAVDSNGEMYYARDSRGKEVYAHTNTRNQIYRSDMTNNHVYAKDENGSQYYALGDYRNEQVAFTADNVEFYAIDESGKQLYPKRNNGDEFYITANGDTVHARYHPDFSAENEYYAESKNGSEMYGFNSYAVDVHGNERYCKDEFGAEFYPQNFSRYAKNSSGDEMYIVAPSKSPEQIVINHVYAREVNGRSIYPQDEHGNRYCVKDVNGTFMFAKTADGKRYYPFNHAGYVLVPSDGNVLVTHTDSLHVDTTGKLRKFKYEHFITTTLNEQGGVEIVRPAFSFLTQIPVALILLLVYLVLRVFY